MIWGQELDYCHKIYGYNYYHILRNGWKYGIIIIV